MKENNPQGTATSRIHPLSKTFSLSDENIFDSGIHFPIISRYYTNADGLPVKSSDMLSRKTILLCALMGLLYAFLFSSQNGFGISDLFNIIFLSIVFVILIPSYESYRISRYLKSKGYIWVTIKDCDYLRSNLEKKVYQLPPRDELATLPGYEDNVEKMVAVYVGGFDKYPDVDEYLLLEPLGEITAYLRDHGSLPEPPPSEKWERYIYEISRPFILFSIIGFLGLIFLSLMLVFYFATLFWIIAPATFLLFIFLMIAFVQGMLITRLSALGYKELTYSQSFEFLNHLGPYVLNAPNKKTLAEIIDLEYKNEYEILFRTLYTAKNIKKILEDSDNKNQQTESCAPPYLR